MPTTAEQQAVATAVAKHGAEALNLCGRYPIESITSEKSPTLYHVANTIERKTAKQWLVMHLAKATTMDSKIVADHMQLNDTATALLNDFGYLKLSEWLVFFYRFANGDYEKFFGTFSRATVYQSVKMFLRDRAAILDRHEAERRKQADEESRKRAITFEQYKQMKRERLQKIFCSDCTNRACKIKNPK